MKENSGETRQRMREILESKKPKTLRDPETLEELRRIFAEKIENFFRTPEAREEHKTAEIAQKVRQGEKIPSGGWWEDCLTATLIGDIRITALDENEYAKSVFLLPKTEKDK